MPMQVDENISWDPAGGVAQPAMNQSFAAAPQPVAAAAPAFDPDAYLASKPQVTAAPQAAFDPDAYLASRPQVAAAPSQHDDSFLVKGLKGVARGAANFAGDMGEAVAGPFGPGKHFQRLFHDLGYGEAPQDQPTYGQQIARAIGIEDTKPGYAGSIGEVAGNPASWFGPGGILAKSLMTAGTGAGSQLGADVAEGTGHADWEGPARLAGGFLGGPLAVRAAKPQVGARQQELLDAGVSQMTPGQLFGDSLGGVPKAIEDRLTSVPVLGSLIQNARGRSVESFNRAVANQVLEPIGERVGNRVAAGHDLIRDVETRISAQYDRLLPQLNYIPDRQFALDLGNIRRQDVAMLPQAQIDQFERIIDARLGPPAPMHGRTFKDIESELTYQAGRYLSSPDGAQRGLGEALQDVVRAMRTNLERSNPDHAERLASLNRSWAMYARVRDAASRRAAGEGVFMPSDLLAAVKRGDRSAGKGAFAKGDALMQHFAETGQAVLPSKLPTSGTAERAATMLMPAGLSYLMGAPHIGVAAAAGMAPYTRAGQWLANRYVAPQTGVRASLGAAGRGPGSAVPFISQMPTPLSTLPSAQSNTQATADNRWPSQ